MASAIMDFNPLHKFIFHVDLSSPLKVHDFIENFTESHSSRTLKVESADVEWGDFGFIQAQKIVFKAAVDLWNFDNIIFLSGNDLMIAQPEYFEAFWKRNKGLNYNGFKKQFKEKLWVFMLNDLISSCDKINVSFGQRREHLRAAEIFEKRNFETTNSHVIYSYDFARWVASGSDPNIATLEDILRYVASVDEVLFQTVFEFSPYCHEKIHLSHGRELMLYAWPSGEGKRKVHFQDIEWYSGKSPYYYDNADISRIAMYDRTLFARKVSGNKKSRKLIKSVKKWIGGERPEFRVKIEFKMTCRGLCLGYIGSLMTDWIGCMSEMTHLQAHCIGNLCLIRPKLDGGVMLASHSELASPGGMVLFGPSQTYLESAVWKITNEKIVFGQKDSRKRYSEGLCLVKPEDHLIFRQCNDIQDFHRIEILNLPATKSEL